MHCSEQAERDSIVIKDEDEVSQYAALLQQQEVIRAELRAIITQPRYALPFLQPGRLVRVLTQPESSSPQAGAGASAEIEDAQPVRAPALSALSNKDACLLSIIVKM